MRVWSNKYVLYKDSIVILWIILFITWSQNMILIFPAKKIRSFERISGAAELWLSRLSVMHLFCFVNAPYAFYAWAENTERSQWTLDNNPRIRRRSTFLTISIVYNVNHMQKCIKHRDVIGTVHRVPSHASIACYVMWLDRRDVDLHKALDGHGHGLHLGDRVKIWQNGKLKLDLPLIVVDSGLPG